MAVDTSPAESARSLLNGIDYGALIGGPLQAAITAQATAARSTWEFIQQVGLNTDADGNRSAINVTFLYQRDGEMVKLIVPILTIVPIPMIVIDEIAIDFTANINASASSTTENTSSQDVGGELEAEGKIGWGPFSLTARLKASYSSKQASKATQDSRYSVEYTQVVKVHARQADMPAGLATVLNILSSAATSGTTNGALTVSPALATVDETAPGALQMIEIQTRNSNALNVATEVTIALPLQFKGCFQFSDFPSGLPINWVDAPTGMISITRSTDARGRLALNLTTTGTKPVPMPPPNPVLVVSATIKGDKEPQETFLPIRVLRALPSPSLVVSPSPLHLPDGTTPVTVTVSSAAAGAAGASVAVASGTAPSNLDFPASVQLGADGKKTLPVKWKTAGPHDAEELTFTLSLEGADFDTVLEVTQSVARAGPMRLAAPRETPTTRGLNAIQGKATQTWTVVMQGREGAGGRQPVSIRFDPAAVAVRYEGRALANGNSFDLDERNMARLEFEAVQGAAARDTEVVLESILDGAATRKVIPVQIH